MKTIAEIIKEKREARGWTRQELADIAGIGVTTLGYYETGRGYPGIMNAIQLADAFGCTLDALVGRRRPS